MTLENVPVVGAVRCWLYLVAKALGVGLARCYLILSLQWVVAPFLGDEKPPGLDICGGVDCSGTNSPGTRNTWARFPGALLCSEPGFEVGS
jgi:hypothetical protein